MNIVNLSESVKTAVRVAQSLAKEYHHKEFGPAHLLKGLMHQEVGLKNLLQSIGKDTAYISDWAEVRIEDYSAALTVPDEMLGNSQVKQVFEEADNMRIKLGQDLITPVCVLIALIKPNVGFDANQLKSFPVKERELLDIYLSNEDVNHAVNPSVQATNGSDAPKQTIALLKYCVDRTSLAKQGKVDPIIGRERETRMVMEILSRRTKPNVMITGDAGVGKTALVDGFALSIVNGQVPASLKNVQLFELDLGSLIAGASYKGEIEDRLKNILREIKQFEKAILFIDEIHTLLDNKGPIGGGVGNLLKPELARGEITVIGATTIDEYRKVIEPEQAFSRRFEVLQVNEPDTPTAIKMLKKLVPQYEEHHSLKIDANTAEECVRLAQRYMKDRRLPDSAFDLLDRTMAAIRLMNDTTDTALSELRTELDELKAQDDAGDLIGAYKWLYTLYRNKISAVLLGQLEDETQVDTFETPDEYIAYFERNLSRLEELAQNKTEVVNKHDIAAIISYKTGIPLGKIQAQEKERLLGMEGFLKKRVVGQDQALKAVSDAILESRSGLNKKGQPIGSFFLLGPTGTGKTELAKSIAEFLFNDEKAMIRFDMSEFKEEHSAALLYGAPPGYVGYEEGGLLVNKIRQQPYSVVLFDEIEKAHPSVFDIFLQILDEGHMHDRLGKQGDFSNALVLFTSNIGSEWVSEQISRGHMPTSNQLMEVMANKFRPEFLARLSEIVPFAPIHEENVVRIFEIQLKSLTQALDKMGINMQLSAEAKNMLALSGFTPKYGARQLSAVIRNQLRRPISRYIISGELKKGNTIAIDKKSDDIELLWSIS
ncbi:ATP-dependent Clp protease ATP-binding subunit [Mucilaginibacter rubeus]|uniref:ATP-dependent Clp protease ATP-binding subunit n=1 Tax=Mucilaginibacter rubeus TaxID=2027860 RepID=A0AAE6JHS1_9SPHI|nr:MULTISPECIES: ATP-dependent Clp protease ATP-binding subunit [Mucilaginibacter]QEM05310.1 ATP-dependent Clp protease ATP-binding subunit [Mucilaginibacter rubeus]QEM17900.1 ATP-dependent Clp protease ATP-binding subunit [Mucilaginibacter gossypii]QTE45567.1 ATP-dependent Clp protease ATP-binding subunit [Mucilaginibacter rubeus]QTE52164.1 ATP-dependent Clp protease ATP-binding subunit [Mucilaginibacter rubeus]QTE57252.1 ATP-dependent Clp protease ATP-binding subunit [Mucilaginibacter rubeus